MTKSCEKPTAQRGALLRVENAPLGQGAPQCLNESSNDKRFDLIGAVLAREAASFCRLLDRQGSFDKVKRLSAGMREAEANRVLGRRPVELRKCSTGSLAVFQSRSCSELKLYVPFQA